MSPADVVDVAGWPVVSQEFRGDEPKDWVAPPEDVTSDDKGAWWLYKPIKTGRQSGYRRFDDVSEYLAFRFAGLIGLPTAEIRLAKGEDAEGIISRNVASDGWDLVSGDALLADCDGYVSIATDDRSKERVGHNLANINSVLAAMGGPMGSECADWRADEVFAGFLVFDAWIANTDRHALNWAVLSRGPIRRLAHSFDHGSALASGVRDDRLVAVDVAGFCGRGYATRFEGGAKRTLVDLATEAVVLTGGRAHEWGDRLASVDPAAWAAILIDMPRLSDVRRRFLDEMLMENRRRITDA